MMLEIVEIPNLQEDLATNLVDEIEALLSDLLANDKEVEIWREGNKISVGLREEDVVRQFLVPGRVVVLRRSPTSRPEGSVELVISKTISSKIKLIEEELSSNGYGESS